MLVMEVIALVLAALVTGVFVGPWVALTRTLHTFEAPMFLLVTRRLSAGLGPLMTVLFPLELATLGFTAYLQLDAHVRGFAFTLAALVLYALTLVVTMVVEVPIVKQIESWTVPTLPEDWEAKRDRWQRFHLLRVVPGVLGLGLAVVGAVLR